MSTTRSRRRFPDQKPVSAANSVEAVPTSVRSSTTDAVQVWEGREEVEGPVERDDIGRLSGIMALKLNSRDEVGMAAGDVVEEDGAGHLRSGDALHAG